MARSAVRSRRLGIQRAGRLGLVLVLAVYGLLYARNPGRGGFLDAIDLAIHETGHLVFSPFGEFLGIFGGTLFQLIVPLAFVTNFAVRGERFSAMIPLWWAAQSLLNVSVYVRDARAQALPLVGGGEHDWTYLLGRFGLLARDHRIGDAVHFLGVIVMVGALLGALNWIGDAAPAEAAVDPAPAAPSSDDPLPPGERPL